MGIFPVVADQQSFNIDTIEVNVGVGQNYISEGSFLLPGLNF